jgi:XTP/dITP diphosphohydrolase
VARRLDGPSLVVASHNPGKVVELAALLSPFGIAAVSAAELGLEEPEEHGASFAANARLKAEAAARASALPALADDSGLEVAALGGAPGIHSARWAGPEKNFAAAMARIERELAGTDSTARFVCALALCWPDGHCEAFEGTVEGRLVFPPRGKRGFGYDPIFVPDGDERTFGEMDPAEKDRISHRADAFAKLTAACLPQPAKGS